MGKVGENKDRERAKLISMTEIRAQTIISSKAKRKGETRERERGRTRDRTGKGGRDGESLK